MRQTGLNMEIVKRRNRSAILRLISGEGPISKKDIAARLSLTPAAVTQICGEFMESGLLLERGIGNEEVIRAGRKKILIDINPVYSFIYGINIDPEKTEIALCDLKGEAVGITTVKTVREVEPEAFLADIAAVCGQLREETKISSEKIAGAGVGITGIVDRERTKSIRAYGIWEKPVEIGRLLEEQLHIPVKVENNVNAFAAAELLFGRGRRHDNLLLVKWGPGVGSSVIIDSRIYEGRHGKAAELGHFIVEKDGELCGCGRRGCLETKVAGWVLQKKIPGFPDQMDGQNSQELAQAVDLFARAIVNAATILAPERVILYGGLFRNPMLREMLTDACSSYDGELGGGRICCSELAEKEGYIGPVAFFVRENIFCGGII